MTNIVERAAWHASCVAMPALSLVSQTATKPRGSPIPSYKSTSEISLAQRKLRWTQDPIGGRLDIMKHPRMMQEAIEKHPDYSGDCEDYAAHWAASLMRNKLADEVWLGCGQWGPPLDHKGHVVCVYRVAHDWWWVSNWHGCEPLAIPDMDGFVVAMKERLSVNIDRAAAWRVMFLVEDDTLVFGPPVVI